MLDLTRMCKCEEMPFYGYVKMLSCARVKALLSDGSRVKAYQMAHYCQMAHLHILCSCNQE